MNDAEFMRIAIEESRKGDWPYGAVINTSSAALMKTAFINVDLTGGILAAEAFQVVRNWSK
jgi:hypothetical protein